MSRVWELSKQELEDLVRKSNSYAQIMRTLSLAVSGDAVKGLKKRIEESQLDVSHFNKNKRVPIAKPLKDLLVENSTASSRDLKKRIVKEGLFKDQCSKCSTGNVWQNEPITLQLDHINGVHSDNRLENLRILCPNCHSQTSTFGTRRLRKDHLCEFCGAKVWSKSTRCRSCASKQAYGKGRKVERPSYDDLNMLLANNSYVAVGEMFGVSDNAVRKWLKQYEKYSPLV